MRWLGKAVHAHNIIRNRGVDLSTCSLPVCNYLWQLLKAKFDGLCCAQDTCYHCPFAHPGLCEALDLSEYHSVCYENNSFQLSPLAPLEERPIEGQSEWDIVTGPRFDGEICVPHCSTPENCDCTVPPSGLQKPGCAGGLSLRQGSCMSALLSKNAKGYAL